MDKPTIECVESRVAEDGLQYSRFVAEPLERGYGVTLGNALRRVLLADLEGAAITAVRIEGVPHEFTTIPGVVEDVIDIILNLKGLVLRSHAEEMKVMRLSVNRSGEVTAADIAEDPEIEVINPLHKICTLEEGATLEMEMVVERGKGFVPAERSKNSHHPIGTIPIDAIYMPVRKVNYLVEDTRVGQITDFDRLVLEVWTNGAIDPVKAVSTASQVLINQFAHFAALAGDVQIAIGGVAADTSSQTRNAADEVSIEELELSVRAYNCLKRANIFTLGDLLKKTERELMEIKNFGRKSAEEVIERLKTLGYNLKPGVGGRSADYDDDLAEAGIDDED
jgi:DNA-directed RNA polymerase subunit alpha